MTAPAGAAGTLLQREVGVNCPNCGIELWATSDACDSLGISRKTWSQWQRRDGFPQPHGQLGGRPVWIANEVRAWDEDRPRTRHGRQEVV
jgi:predicted DNA-binding transcriptional regulator AlpA